MALVLVLVVSKRAFYPRESELYRYEFAAGGSKKILRLTLTPLTSLSGDAQGMVMIVRDETLLQKNGYT